MSEYDLNTLKGMRRAFADAGFVDGKGVADGIYCPECKAQRRIEISVLYTLRWNRNHAAPPVGPVLPAFLQIICLQCETVGHGVMHRAPRGEGLTLHWPVASGIATPNTPKPVAFYLDEAAKCESANASTAAAAMYRGALDHILYGAGYTKGMLGARIAALLNDVAASNAPAWAHEIDHEYLDIIKEVGNAAMHTNDGTVAAQEHIDPEMLAKLRGLIVELLETIFELPARKARRKAELKTTVAKLAKPSAGKPKT